jgi:hypothetical protein
LLTVAQIEEKKLAEYLLLALRAAEQGNS